MKRESGTYIGRATRHRVCSHGVLPPLLSGSTLLVLNKIQIQVQTHLLAKCDSNLNANPKSIKNQTGPNVTPLQTVKNEVDHPRVAAGCFAKEGLASVGKI